MACLAFPFGFWITVLEPYGVSAEAWICPTDKVDPNNERIGARGSYSFARRWAVYFIGDLGGFGIGDAAQFTYQVEANIAFRISHPLSAFAGYRVLGYTLEDDAGDETTFTQYGPKIGAALTF